jgi:hypothetical protein
MTAAEVAAAIAEIQADSSSVLAIVEAADPAFEAPIGVAELLASLAAKALAAWSKASATPITEASVAALMPNPQPLTPPDAQIEQTAAAS